MAAVTAVPGIDVSRWQGAFNWKAHAGKIGFGMAKADEGLDITDPEFGNNWNGMWELDRLMPRFAYHFFHAALDPVAQAARLVATVKAHGLLPGDNFVIDCEATDPDTGLNDEEAPAVTAARLRECLGHVNVLAPGHRVLVYTNTAFGQAGNCAGANPWYLWVADYGVNSPKVPAPWHQWTFWQWSGNPLDLDRFNGTTAALRAFTRMPDKR
jgi:GH25 family lysozyme M1 (1,4-beta-N-acetylmuramidase)